MKKYKEKYKSGMVFRSEKYPWTDFVISYVYYSRLAETSYEFNANSIICWDRINKEEFLKHVSVAKGVDYNKLYNGEIDSFPFPSCGETTQKGLDAQIRKYELECSGEYVESIVEFDDETGYNDMTEEYC